MYTSDSLTPRYADVWIRAFIDPSDISLGYVTYKEVLFHGSIETHAWGWIASKGSYGWIEKKPFTEPAKPKSMFYASSDEAFEDAKRILEEYNNDKEVG